MSSLCQRHRGSIWLVARHREQYIYRHRRHPAHWLELSMIFYHQSTIAMPSKINLNFPTSTWPEGSCPGEADFQNHDFNEDAIVIEWGLSFIVRLHSRIALIDEKLNYKSDLFNCYNGVKSRWQHTMSMVYLSMYYHISSMLCLFSITHRIWKWRSRSMRLKTASVMFFSLPHFVNVVSLKWMSQF